MQVKTYLISNDVDYRELILEDGFIQTGKYMPFPMHVLTYSLSMKIVHLFHMYAVHIRR